MLQSFFKSSSVAAQMVRYGFVASFGLVIDFGTVIFTKQILGLHYLLAACAGFILGVIVTYILSNMVVFGQPKGDRKKLFVTFVIIGIIGLGILNLIMWGLTGGLGLNYVISKALATIVVFAWNFFARKSLYKEAEELPYEL